MGAVLSLLKALYDQWSENQAPKLPLKPVEMDPQRPESRPLFNLQELEAWLAGFDPFNVSQIPLAKRPVIQDQCKVLVCHDMQGGYAEDNWIQGSVRSLVYSVRFWQFVDVFVYFSHHRVTIPPVCWTHAAHKNGVKILGTFITEWDQGKADTYAMLERFQLDENGKRHFLMVDKLVSVAKYYQFDGWLINIEVAMLNENQTQDLCDFVAQLTREMHQMDPGSLVVWWIIFIY